MTKKDIEKEYQINENGVITSPGKFEGEMYYAVYFWNASLEGMCDDTIWWSDTEVSVFNVNETDKVGMPELNDVETVKVWEDEQGFVHCMTA
jgi:hypothetical protein